MKKIEILFGDPDTYEKMQGHITETQKFNKSIRKLVANKKKPEVRLIKYHTTTPKLYSLPKTHISEYGLYSYVSFSLLIVVFVVEVCLQGSCLFLLFDFASILVLFVSSHIMLLCSLCC